jgi:hypothetical protein
MRTGFSESLAPVFRHGFFAFNDNEITTGSRDKGNQQKKWWFR